MVLHCLQRNKNYFHPKVEFSLSFLHISHVFMLGEIASCLSVQAALVKQLRVSLSIF
jgi:hypothetical protein